MSEQFLRAYELQIGERIWKTDELGNGVNIQFKVDHAFSISPNNCEIDLFNLSSESRSYLEALASSDPTGVRLKAGYVGAVDTIFYGTFRNAETSREGPNLVTQVSAGDGDTEYLTATVAHSWSVGTPVPVILADLVAATGLLPGNVATIAPFAIFRTKKDGAVVSETPVLPGPYAVSGKAFEALDAFIKATDLRWTVYNGEFFGNVRGIPSIIGEPILVAPHSGMVGSPRVERSTDEEGTFSRINVAAKLHPGLKLGQALGLQSEKLKAAVVVVATSHFGSLDGGDWNSDFSSEYLEL